MHLLFESLLLMVYGFIERMVLSLLSKVSIFNELGWAPSSFRSSRKEKHESDSSKTHQDVLQFMDEEDMEAFGIAPQQVRSTKTYQNEQASAPDDFPEKQNLTAEESKAIAHLSSLLQVTKDTIGIR